MKQKIIKLITMVLLIVFIVNIVPFNNVQASTTIAQLKQGQVKYVNGKTSLNITWIDYSNVSYYDHYQIIVKGAKTGKVYLNKSQTSNKITFKITDDMKSERVNIAVKVVRVIPDGCTYDNLSGFSDEKLTVNNQWIMNLK